jgi:hypothetical protein
MPVAQIDLDRDAGENPRLRRIQPEIAVELVGEFEIARLGIEMRQQEQAAHDPQDVELVGRIEMLVQAHLEIHCAKPPSS